MPYWFPPQKRSPPTFLLLSKFPKFWGEKKNQPLGPGTVEIFTYLEVVPFLFLMHELELIRCEVFRVETDHGNWDGFGHPEYSFRDFEFFVFFLVKIVITMDFLVDFFGTGKYAGTKRPMNCVIKGF